MNYQIKKEYGIESAKSKYGAPAILAIIIGIILWSLVFIGIFMPATDINQYNPFSTEVRLNSGKFSITFPAKPYRWEDSIHEETEFGDWICDGYKYTVTDKDDKVSTFWFVTGVSDPGSRLYKIAEDPRYTNILLGLTLKQRFQGAEEYLGEKNDKEDERWSEDFLFDDTYPGKEFYVRGHKNTVYGKIVLMDGVMCMAVIGVPLDEKAKDKLDQFIKSLEKKY